jgi:uncharacterized protein YndB with AHSA1/START domain
MTRGYLEAPNPKLDLVIERTVDAPRELVWKAWTEPERLKKWFTPAPWITKECEVDLRPGGIFRTRLASPEGEESEHVCAYLEVSEHERLIWTNALMPGFRPSSRLGVVPPFTAVIRFEALPRGTKYTAMAIHGAEAHAAKHQELGFYDGWGTVTDQLIALVTKS